MPNVFRKSRLHRDHSKMLNPMINRQAAHPVMSAKLTRSRNNCTTPNRIIGRENLAAIDGILKGEVLRIAFGRKKGGIGDVLMTTPTVKAIKRRYPNCKLTYFVDPKYGQNSLEEILKYNPHIDEIVSFSHIKREKYHFYVDVTTVGLARERRGLPPVNRIDMFAEYVGLDLVDPVPTYVVTKEEKAWAQAMIDKWTKGKPSKIVTLHISSVDERRNWPAQKFMELVTQLGAQHSDIFFIIFDQHKKNTWGLRNTFDASHFDIRANAALIDASHLFVGPDSGLLHIAGALEKHIVSLFGSTPAAARINHYANAVSIEAKVMCRNCWYDPCNLQFVCMTQIQVADVMRAVKKRLYSNKVLSVPLDGRIFVSSTPGSSEASFVHENLCNALGLSANIVLDTEETNETVTGQDYVIGAVDLNFPAKRISRQGQVVAYVCSGPKNIDEENVNVLNSYRHLFVPNKETTNWLRDNNVSTSVTICPLPLKTSQPIAKVGDTLLFATYTKEEEQRERIVSSFKKAVGRNLKRSLMLITPTRIADDPDPRIYQSRLQDVDWDSIDCFIEADSHPIAIPLTMKALSLGKYCITPDIKLNHLPEGIVDRVPVKDCLYQQKPLKETLSLFCELESILSTDSNDRVKYFRKQNSYETVAHQILLGLRNM